jgi:hypothetical protein
MVRSKCRCFTILTREPVRSTPTKTNPNTAQPNRLVRSQGVFQANFRDRLAEKKIAEAIRRMDRKLARKSRKEPEAPL